MTAEEFAKATGKSVAEVEKELAKGENKVANSAESGIGLAANSSDYNIPKHDEPVFVGSVDFEDEKAIHVNLILK